MQSIFQYLINLNPDIFLALILAVLFSLEQLFTAVNPFVKRANHLVGSVVLQAGYFIVNYILAFLVVMCLNGIDNNRIGLFNVIAIPYWLKVIIGIICIDFVNYWEHRVNHVWGLFWRLHRVHHSDTMMDSATTYRFHPLDAVLDNIAGLIAAFAFGLDGANLVLWLILYIPLLALHHSNYFMPGWFDKTLGKVIVSPNIHKVHHHQEQVFTDSNYGLIFIFWDKLFKTYKELPVSEIRYGLKEFDEPGRQNTWFLLKSPFINVKK